jgi:hypothetical protein
VDGDDLGEVRCRIQHGRTEQPDRVEVDDVRPEPRHRIPDLAVSRAVPEELRHAHRAVAGDVRHDDVRERGLTGQAVVGGDDADLVPAQAHPLADQADDLLRSPCLEPDVDDVTDPHCTPLRAGR